MPPVPRGGTSSPPAPTTRRDVADLIWLVPVLVVVVGMVPVAIAVVRAVEEARSLIWQLRVLGTLRPALVELRTAGQELAASLEKRSRT